MMGGLIWALGSVILQATHPVLSKDLSEGNNLPEQHYKQTEPFKFSDGATGGGHSSHLVDECSTWLLRRGEGGHNITSCWFCVPTLSMMACKPYASKGHRASAFEFCCSGLWREPLGFGILIILGTGIISYVASNLR